MCRVMKLILLSGAVTIPTLSFGSEKITTGWIEPVRITPGNVLLDGKLDTGADKSSLSCKCGKPQERDGKRWIRLSIKDRDGKLVEFEREVVRIAKIKRHAGQQQERPVVKLGLCIANIYREIEVNLVDRSGFKYPLLVGRNFLENSILVDSSMRKTTSPACVNPGAS